MTCAKVVRLRSASGNSDSDYFRAECSTCGWKSNASYPNRTIEGRTLAQRDATEHTGRCGQDHGTVLGDQT